MKSELRKRIVIASLLKPVDDTRMYEKMAVSLADSGRYEVFIIGFPGRRISTHAFVHFRPLHRFKRISVSRLFAPGQVLRLLIEVDAELVIVNSPELLIVAILNRIFFGRKIAYDIRENYYRNVLYSSVYSRIVKWPLAMAIRLKEKLLAPLFHWHFLAEKGYEREMGFYGKSYSVVENKALVPSSFKRQLSRDNETRLLFSGTLAVSTGVFEAVALAKALHLLDGHIRLRIVGYCAQASVFAKLKEAIAGCDYIELIGGNALVPHSTIMEAIAECDFGIIYYPPSAHTANSYPTKLYEYLACRLPILLQDHAPWVALCAPSEAAVAIDFNRYDAAVILKRMKKDFYVKPAEHVTWPEEAGKLLTMVDLLVTK
jgi:hypothetical protein